MQLQVGQKAPTFKTTSEKGETVSLSDYKGKKLVLYFYPKDDTPTCTIEACDLRDNYEGFKSKGYEILGISMDTEKKHAKFIKKFSLPFSLLSDVEHKIISDYGVWGEKMLFGRKYLGIIRTTFVINESGIIEQIIEKVDAKNHSAQII